MYGNQLKSMLSTPPLLDIPLTSVNCEFTLRESSAKIYSSCRFPLNHSNPKYFPISLLYPNNPPLFLLFDQSQFPNIFLFLQNVFHSPVKNLCTITLPRCICNLSFSHHFSNAHFYSRINLCLLEISISFVPIHI